MEKTTSIYLYQGIIRIVTSATTTIGCPIANGPVYFLKNTDSPEEIGTKALEALNSFQNRSVPHPKNQEEWELYGKKFDRSLQLPYSEYTFWKKGAKKLLLEMDENIITVLPIKNLIAANIKGKGYGSFLEHKNRTCQAEPEELGRAILAAFEDCE